MPEALHVCGVPALLQSTHCAPPAPHSVVVVPGWQVPTRSQHPAHDVSHLSTTDPELEPLLDDPLLELP